MGMPAVWLKMSELQELCQGMSKKCDLLYKIDNKLDEIFDFMEVIEEKFCHMMKGESQLGLKLEGDFEEVRSNFYSLHEKMNEALHAQGRMASMLVDQMATTVVEEATGELKAKKALQL